jgi:hypothetical protein
MNPCQGALGSRPNPAAFALIPVPTKAPVSKVAESIFVKTVFINQWALLRFTVNVVFSTTKSSCPSSLFSTFF